MVGERQLDLFKYWRNLLRNIWTDTDGNTNSDAHSYSHAYAITYSHIHCDTHVYASTNTYTKASSDSERPANTAPAPVVRLNAQPGIPSSILSFIGNTVAAPYWRLSQRPLVKRLQVAPWGCVLNKNACTSRIVDVVLLTLNCGSRPRESRERTARDFAYGFESFDLEIKKQLFLHANR